MGRGVRVFASSRDEPRARRPTDVALLLLAILGLGLLVIAARAGSVLQDDFDQLVAHLPLLLDGVWSFGSDLVVVWSVVLVVAALVARRLSLARDCALAAVLALVGCSIASLVSGSANVSVARQLSASGGPPSFPALKLAMASAIIITTSPHLGRPLRHVGRWIIGLASISTVALGVARGGGVLAALALGTIVAAVVHLLFGSPGGRPSLRRVEEMFEALGLQAHDLQPALLQPEGVWVVVARLADGSPVRVKVYGRDAWDGQFVMSLWQFLWYRDAGSRMPTTRVQLVEHEAFLILLARQAGVAAPALVAAGGSRSGDAVLVVGSTGSALDALADVSDSLVRDLWHELDIAHSAGLSLGRIDPASIGADGKGAASLLDWSGGRTAPTAEQKLQDRAQMLVSTAMVVGNDRAIAAAKDVLGVERLEGLLPYLQAAGMSRTLRRVCDEQDYELKGLRTETANHLGVELPDLVRLRRVTLGSVLQLVLLLVASVALISALSSIDFASVTDEFRAMSLGAVLVGLVVAQIGRGSGALSNQGAAPVALPYGPLVQLQFAIAYINMAVPSTAGRLALVVRFYQRVGSTAAVALGAGALDSVANFVVQVTLVVVTLGFGLGSIEFDLTTALSELPTGLLRLVTVVVVVFIVGAIVVLVVPSLRRRVMPTIDQFREGLAVLKNPRNAALLLGGNLLGQVLLAFALGAFAEATGHPVGLFDLLLINNLVGTFASLIPVPNGMGVTEAGLTAGLVAAGVPESAALAAALAFRLCSSYLPPVWGFFSFRWLQQHEYV
jgi:uncharacterized membrane protein YbhN (UPF0104 family)